MRVEPTVHSRGRGILGVIVTTDGDNSGVRLNVRRAWRTKLEIFKAPLGPACRPHPPKAAGLELCAMLDSF